MSALLLLSGCSSTTEDPEATRTVRFAVIAAPRVGAPAPNKGPGVGADDDALSNEDLLLEVVTQLSADPAIDFTLVPGPLVANAEEESREGLAGALGSLAGPVFAALATKEPESEALSEALGKALRGHEGEPGYWGKRVGRLRPLALPPSGKVPEDPQQKKPSDRAADDRPAPLVIVARGQGTTPSDFPVEVTVGTQVTLSKADGRVTLTLPPLPQPPHLYAILTVEGGELRVELKTAQPSTLKLPKAPAPVRLWRVGDAP